MVLLGVLKWNEKAVNRKDAIVDLLRASDCRSWQILWLANRLFAKLETLLLSFEEESVIPEGQEEVIVECAVFNA